LIPPTVIAVDAMSGDHGPATCVPGALAVLRSEPACELVAEALRRKKDSSLRVRSSS
jgi:fatty acid/phospholipid biosynthesis enzyme